MRRMTEIEQKTKENKELTKDDLIFLYEIDHQIQGFGYNKDPRIKEIRDKRNIKNDLSIATGYKKEEISITQKEALSGNIKYHYGDLDLINLTSKEKQKLKERNPGLAHIIK